MNKISLSDASKVITKGTTPSTIGASFVSEGINYLKSESISSGKYVDNNVFEHITQETHDRLGRSQLQKDDLVISIAGAYLGKMALIRESDLPLNTNQAVGIVRLEKNKVLPEYAYYYLTQPHITDYINRLSAQSSQPNLNLELLGSLEVEYLPLEEQKKRVRILSFIDDLLLNNNEICSDLEGIAKLLYDYWFVQFDFPDENGKPYKSSGGKMVWNEELKREIPEGWEAKPLGDFISVIRGISYKPSDELKCVAENSVLLLKSNNIQNGVVNFEQPVLLPRNLAGDEQWLTKGSVFITMSSGSKAHMGKTAIIYKDLPYVFGAFCAKIDIRNEVMCFVSTYLRSDWFRAYIENVTAGTSINNISNEQLTSIMLPIPENRILREFEDRMTSAFDRQGEIIEENQQLTSLRDFLLPMLMNGQVTFKENL